MFEIKIFSDEGGSYKALHLPNGQGMTLMSANKGMLLLFNDLLKTTSARAWGLSFYLYHDRKLKIEYDYNKPEDYDEVHEL